MEHEVPTWVREDLRQIESDLGVPETTRTALMEARLGQGRFRRDLIAYWGGACAVTICDVEAALRASHCKPWRDANNAERLDPANGLLLVATLDALFDSGLISFDDEGRMLTASELTAEQLRTLGVTPAPIRGTVTDRQRSFAGRSTQEWRLPDKQDRAAIRRVRDAPVEFALRSGATEGQQNAVEEALTSAGCYVSK